ncbi:MAG: SpoIIE family protein phosphatase [Erysipelotrichaceae bacterium]|nr:SpoIIE family protein phosphatase [Erysipelotrichaceae bacterium]
MTEINKKKETVKRNIIAIILCFFILSVFACKTAYFVSGEEEDETRFDSGKHNGHVAVDPVGQDEDYSAVLYNNTNGLPTSEANDIVETSNGFIWIGSYSGLIRYDGSTFERMDSTAGITGVKCLYVDSKDRLWIGTNNNGVALMNHDEYRKWGYNEGLKSPSIRSIVEDPQGRILVATTQGLLVFDEDLNPYYLSHTKIKNAFLHDLRRGIDGTIYGLTNSGDVFTIRDCVVHHYYSYQDTSIRGINCIFPDPENAGLLYLETVDSVLYHDSLDNLNSSSELIDISPLSQIQSFENIDGDIWICARNGIGVLNETGFHKLENIPMNNSIGHVMTDYEGNLWFTSTRQGVMKIVPNRFIDLFERYGITERVVNSTKIYDNKLFAATDNGLLIFDEDGLVSEWPLKKAVGADGNDLGFTDLLQMLDGVRIRSIISDSKGRMWFCTWNRYGLLRYDDGEITAFSAADGLFSDAIRTVYERKDGSILVANTGGVSVIEGDRIVASYDESDNITNTEILSLAEGKNGEIIIGSDGGGIFIVSENGTRNINYKDGLTSGAVMRIKYDEDHHIYWIVTGDSLAYMNEDYEVTSISNFPYPNNFDVYQNGKEELWVLCSNGIYIAKIEDLLKNEKIDAFHYSISNGLPCIATANSYSELTEEGDLYIAGTTGIAKVNMEEPIENVSNLKAAVPYVEIDGQIVYPDETGKFLLPHDFTKLTIHGHVFTYSLVEPTVSYRLEGIDKFDNVGRSCDVFPAYYTNLPGGTYDFVMDLMDSMGQVSKTVSVQIVKEKAFYEQPWFYVVAFIAVSVLIFETVRTYVNERLQLQEKHHREEEEKKRILNELTMAANIQQSMLPHIFPPFPDRKEFEIYALMDPAKGVGGDFYDFFMIDEDHLCMVMADVSGKGIPGALFMMVSKIILQTYAKTGISPAEILNKTNETICSNNQAQMFVTVWIGILEISTGILTAANAGHEYPIVKSPEGQFELMKDKHDFVVGGMEGIKYHEYRLDLHAGSKLFLYTDGIPEASDIENKMFGTDRLIDALNIDQDASPDQIIGNVAEAVGKFVKEAEQFDDLTMLCFEYKGK